MGRAYGISVEGVASAWDRTWSARDRHHEIGETCDNDYIAAYCGRHRPDELVAPIQENRPLHTNPRDPVDQDGDGSSLVWAVSGDPLLVATVTVDHGTDSNRSGFRRNEDFTAH